MSAETRTEAVRLAGRHFPSDEMILSTIVTSDGNLRAADVLLR